MKEQIRKTLRSPTMDVIVIVFIVASVVLLIVEVSSKRPMVLFWADVMGDLVTGLFFVELSLRFWVAPSKRAYVREYWIDILALLPILRVFRVLRVLRLLRLFRAGIVVGRRAAGFRAMMRSSAAEYVIVMSVVGIIVLFGTVGRMMEDEVEFERAFFNTVHSLIAGEPIGWQPELWHEHVVAVAVSFGGMVTFALLTGVVTSYMVENLRRRLRAQDMDISDLRDHVILCGFNRTAPRIIMELRAHRQEARRAILIIAEADPTPTLQAFGIAQENIFHIHDDFTRVDVLKKARIEEAAKAIVVADDSVPRSDQDRDARSILAALTIERISPKAYTCVELLNGDNAPHLAVAGIEEVVVPADFGGHLLGEVAMYRGLMPVVKDIFSRGKGQDLYLIGVPPEYAGKAYRDLYVGVKERLDAAPLALIRYEGTKHHVVTNPALRHEVRGDEAVVVIAASGREEELAAFPPPAGARVG